MRIRHAIGATALAITVVATLSSCADDPKDKAFGGLGGDMPSAPNMPNAPSLNPSLMPTDLPTGPGSPGGLSSGGSSGLSSGGSDGGLSSGGSDSGGSSGLTSGGSSGLSSGGSDSRPTPRPTYNSNANGEVIGQNCRYTRSTGRMTYDIDIQNQSSDMAFRYSYTVVFKVGSSPTSSIASKTIATRPNTVTVNAGGSRKLNAHTTYNTNDRLVYSCQVTSARKILAR